MSDEVGGLSPGDLFLLARSVRSALYEKIEQSERPALARRFGMLPGVPPDWIGVLSDADEGNLIGLANFLGVPIPGQADDQADGQAIGPSAADIDAYAELVSAETALRDVIRTAVPNWKADLDAAAVAKLEEKKAEEDKRRDGIAVSQDLLDYTEIYQLQDIIKKHWDPSVQAILDDKKRTEVYLGIVFDVRNAIGHSRPVFPAERLLLAGAAGQIRNQLARYKAMSDGPQCHYPSLNSARDSMGAVAPSNPTFAGRSYSDPFTPPPRLEVGDTVTFELEATDPRGRELTWKAYSIPSASSAAMPEHYPLIGEATGDRVQITWIVGEDEVGENRQVAITVANSGRYHRERNYDDACVFSYHVNPPPDA